MQSATNLYTIRETAQILKISVASVYRLMSKGDLQWHDVGKLRRVSQKQIDDYLERNQNGNQD